MRSSACLRSDRRLSPASSPPRPSELGHEFDRLGLGISPKSLRVRLVNRGQDDLGSSLGCEFGGHFGPQASGSEVAAENACNLKSNSVRTREKVLTKFALQGLQTLSWSFVRLRASSLANPEGMRIPSRFFANLREVLTNRGDWFDC